MDRQDSGQNENEVYLNVTARFRMPLQREFVGKDFVTIRTLWHVVAIDSMPHLIFFSRGTKQVLLKIHVSFNSSDVSLMYVNEQRNFTAFSTISCSPDLVRRTQAT